MDNTEANRLMNIANNSTWGDTWFDRDMNALAEARAEHNLSEGGDRR